MVRPLHFLYSFAASRNVATIIGTIVTSPTIHESTSIEISNIIIDTSQQAMMR